MKLFAVFKTAIYRHECGGIFSSLRKANAAAKKLITAEPDDHHDFKVYQFELDRVAATTGHRFPSLVEADPVAIWVRSGTEVRRRK